MRIVCMAFKSIIRRLPQIMRYGIATLLAVAFMTGMLIFQENMYEWQMATNKKSFGDWFVMEKYSENPSEGLTKHPFLDKPVTAKQYARLYDYNDRVIDRYLGCMSEDFINKNNIKCDTGRMPENANEIAIDYSTLSEMGYNSSLGQKILIQSPMNPEQDIEYTLVGVLKNYTNSWSSGEKIPGALVTEEGAKRVSASAMMINLYPLKKYVKTKDFKQVFNGINDSLEKALVYNDSVYEYKAWGDEKIYNYMYFLVMVIGVVAVIYQFVNYYNLKRKSNDLLRQLGASDFVINAIMLFENILVIALFGVIGTGIAVLAGKLICNNIETNMGVSFFNVTAGIYAKIIISMVSIILLEQIAMLIADKYHTYGKILFKNKKEKVYKKGKKNISEKHTANSLQRRMYKNISWLQKLGVRAFFVVCCMVVIICGVNLYNAFNAYKTLDGRPDLVGYKKEESSSHITFAISQDKNQEYVEAKPEDDLMDGTANKVYNKLYNHYLHKPWIKYRDAKDFRKNVDFSSMMATTSAYYKYGTTNIYMGMSNDFYEMIDSIPGVQGSEYSYYDTQRRWSWDDLDPAKMDLDKLFMDKLRSEDKKAGYTQKYYYAMEYLDMNKDSYNKIKPYLDEAYDDYEKFVNGEYMLVILDKNAEGVYDDTIKPGAKIYHSYTSKTDVPFAEKLNEAYIEYENADSQIYDTQRWFGVCGEITVAGVVHLTDEIKEDLQDFIVEYGYYTGIAASSYARRLYEEEYNLIEKQLKIETPDDLKFPMLYNQFSVRYDLSSLYSATENIIMKYCKDNNVVYISTTQEKLVLRSMLINAFVQYGLTMLAVLLLSILISVIIYKNRLEAMKTQLSLLKKLGGDNGKISKICMLEGIKQSLWCVFTIPVMVIIFVIMSAGFIRKI